MPLDITPAEADPRFDQGLQALLQKQKEAFRAEGEVTFDVRKDRLKRLKAMIVENKIEFAKATRRDYQGARTIEGSLLAEYASKVDTVDFALHNLRRWMKPIHRKSNRPFSFFGAKSQVRYFPKGVVGIISPWNLPFGLTVSPLASALAAGNRAMIKPSEIVPETAAMFAETIPNYFTEDEVAVVTGGVEIGQAFSSLPFDHLLFTGSTRVGAAVMSAAARNLVPVTLELGGKSPVIIGRSADINLAGSRIIFGKMMNGGQLCLSPDYVVVPEDLETRIIARLKSEVLSMYPDIGTNKDFTAIINEHHFSRLERYIDDAVNKGAKLTIVGAETSRPSPDCRRMPLHILQNVTDDMLVMQEEIFGPILPILSYKKINEVPDLILPRRNPLGLYYFGQDEAEQEFILQNVQSGGVCVNDVTQHYLQEDLPFGGIGASGMGSYHGLEGMRNMSHERAIYKQTGIDLLPIAGARPPFGKRFKKYLEGKLGKYNLD